MDCQYARLLKIVDDEPVELSSLAPCPPSASWTPEEWEAYLSSFESPMREGLLSSDHYDRLAGAAETSIFDYAQESSDEKLVSAVQTALVNLSPAQRKVIQLTFFDLKSTRETASVLGVSQSAVCNLKKRAIKNLRNSLKGVFTSTLMSKQKKEI
jgi:RNA polymerase sigma factor (sigma-70 family)